MSKQKTLVVVGGGAAGFFCAINAARMDTSLRVIIVEKTSKLLSKVKVSGGGRCNVTHACFEVSTIVKRYPRGGNFLKKAFHQFDTSDCIKWFEERAVKLKTESDGRMFSITDSSQTIIDCFLAEANKYGVEIMMNREVKAIQLPTLQNQHLNDRVAVLLATGEKIDADFIVVACGGYPKAGMFEWLRAIGHTIEEPVPSLFTFNIPGSSINSLMGVVVERTSVRIVASKLIEEGPLLITHWGLSGPVILRLSAWGARELAHHNYNFDIQVNWIPPYNEQSLREKWQEIRNQFSAQKISNGNPFALPNRMWAFLVKESGIDQELRWSSLPGKEQNKLIKNLTAKEFKVAGKTTFKEEFVTCGGIKLGEVDANTMQSKLVPNLFFAGEILDVDGITGGFNFQHAWTSGFIAAKSIAQSLNKMAL
jgi:predicted Rossmann fold flavoprotein